MFSRAARIVFIAWFLLLAWLLVRGATRGWTGGVWVGLYLLVLAHPTLLAIEFALSRSIDSRVNGTRVALAVLARAWWREWITSTLVFGWQLPWRAAAEPDRLPASARGRRGVVFVHGFICNRGIWNPWLRRLRMLDRPFVAVSLEPVFAGIDDYVSTVEEAVRRVEAATGLAPIVVAHSMGGLVARAWLRTCDARTAHDRVARIVTIGTPHRGTWLAGLALSPNARQMRMGSAWMSGLGGAEPAQRSGLFTCWWSECDQIVFPPPTAVLPGSEARQLEGVAHVALCRREEIWRDLLERLEA